MPETIRAANGRLRCRPWWGGYPAACAGALLTITLPVSSGAESASGFSDALHGAPAAVSHETIANFTLIVGLLVFAALAVLALLRARREAARSGVAARDDAVALRAEIDRLKALLLAEPQVLVEWPAASDKPEIVGDTTLLVMGGVPERVLAFGAWLEPADAQRVEHAVDTLRREGRGFAMALTTLSDRPVEVEGRAVAGRAVLRLR